MDWDAVDWDSLERMRTAFLAGTSGQADYWQSESDLASYDFTFGRRIGWKWDCVLGELARRGWRPPAGEVLDWGCGTGVAARAFLKHFGETTAHGIVLHDRSAPARDFASRKVRGTYPSASVRREAASDVSAPTVLVSHVRGELSDRQLECLMSVVRRATAVVWIEPGSFDVSRQLIDIREQLRGEFQLVAPCTHQGVCGMLASGSERHWCHHFAPSAPEVHTDGNWVRFGRIAGIDLRSLPFSYLVLDRRPPPPLPAGAVRVIGRPRVHKGLALLFGCQEDGVRDRRLAKSSLPEEFRQVRRGDFGTLQAWRLDGDKIIAVERLPEFADR